MTRLARVFCSFSAALLLASGLCGQGADTPAERPNETPTTPAPKPKRERAISSNLASQLAAGMPKYNPPPKPRPEDEQVDLREIDKPRNAIIRLPKYTVQGQRPAVFRERDLYNERNRAGLALSRNPGLTFGNVLGLNRPIALAMYQEQERLNNMADLNDTADTIGRADPEAGAYLRRETDQTFMRTQDFGYTRPQP